MALRKKISDQFEIAGISLISIWSVSAVDVDIDGAGSDPTIVVGT